MYELPLIRLLLIALAAFFLSFFLCAAVISFAREIVFHYVKELFVLRPRPFTSHLIRRDNSIIKLCHWRKLSFYRRV